MTVKLTILDEVNIKFTNLPLDARKKLVSTFKYDIPGARYSPAARLGRWDGTISLFGLGGNGYIHQLDTIINILNKMNIEVDEIDDKRMFIELKFPHVTESYWADKGAVWPPTHAFAGKPILLRDYQVAAINTFLENPQSLQEISTSAGKTLILTTLCHVCEPLGRTITIVPNKSLVEQTLEDFNNLGLDAGVYFGDRKELNRTHTICTWQSLSILGKKGKVIDNEALTLAEFLDGVKTVICDECHTLKAVELRNLLTNHLINASVRWGLTGTIPKEPYNCQQLIISTGPVVGGIKAHELQASGYLSSCKVNIMQLIDLKEFSSYHEEYKYLTSNSLRLEFVAKFIEKVADSGNTLILVNRIETGEMLKDIIGDSAVFVSGAVKTQDRKDEYDEIRVVDNKILIATYGVASTGINILRLFNLVLFEPGKSFIRVIQSIGRGLRKGSDKDHIEIYDIASTCKYSKRHLSERRKFYKDAQYEFVSEKVDWSK